MATYQPRSANGSVRITNHPDGCNYDLLVSPVALFASGRNLPTDPGAVPANPNAPSVAFDRDTGEVVATYEPGQGWRRVPFDFEQVIYEEPQTIGVSANPIQIGAGELEKSTLYSGRYWVSVVSQWESPATGGGDGFASLLFDGSSLNTTLPIIRKFQVGEVITFEMFIKRRLVAGTPIRLFLENNTDGNLRHIRTFLWAELLRGGIGLKP